MIEQLKDRDDDDGIQLYFDEKEKLSELLINEELYWKQRAKTFWLEAGDTNSKFFHASASSRKKANLISTLKSDDGTMVSDHAQLCRLLKDYYSNIFSGESTNERTDNSDFLNILVISNDQNEMLTTSLEFKEFTEAMKCLHLDKASGPYGLNSAFFQLFWKQIDKEVFQSCNEWLLDCKFSSIVNDTTLVLIPKKDNVDEVKDLRPIAFCNVLNKVIAKVLSNRLQKILPGIISEEQSTFVPGRNITDNVLVAFDLLHYMKRKNGG